jgi:hypothetical protein
MRKYKVRILIPISPEVERKKLLVFRSNIKKIVRPGDYETTKELLTNDDYLTDSDSITEAKAISEQIIQPKKNPHSSKQSDKHPQLLIQSEKNLHLSNPFFTKRPSEYTDKHEFKESCQHLFEALHHDVVLKKNFKKHLPKAEFLVKKFVLHDANAYQGLSLTHQYSKKEEEKYKHLQTFIF